MPTESFNHLFPGYEILGELGRSNARVLTARNQVTGELVAIKHFALNADAGTLRLFQRESDIMTSIKNANVVKIKDIHLDAELPYIVMELIEGGDLRSLLRLHGHLDIPTTIRLGLQMAEAFNAIHEKGIIHRDIKPENIMYRNLHSGELHFLLTDFGIAKLRDSSVSVTGAGMMTYEYASPEQFTDSTKITAATDYYSLGVVLYECLTGSVPFKLEEGRLHTHMNNVINMPPPPLELPENSLLPPSLMLLVNGLLAKQPEARPAEFVKIKKLLKRADMEEAEGITNAEPVTIKKTTEYPIDIPKPANVQPSVREVSLPPIVPVQPFLKKKNDTGYIFISAIIIIIMVVVTINKYKRSGSDDNRSSYSTLKNDSTRTADSLKNANLLELLSADSSKLHPDQSISLTNGEYSQIFYSDHGTWKTDTTGNSIMGVDVSIGQYIIEGLDSALSYFSDRKFNINTDNDFLLYSNTYWILGSEQDGYGINFCSDDRLAKYFCFFISGNGSYKISYLQNSTWNDIKNWTRSDIIDKRGVNRLKIEKKNGEVIFYINEQEVDRRHFNYFYGTDFGFVVGGKQKVGYSNIILSTVP